MSVWKIWFVWLNIHWLSHLLCVCAMGGSNIGKCFLRFQHEAIISQKYILWHSEKKRLFRAEHTANKEFHFHVIHISCLFHLVLTLFSTNPKTYKNPTESRTHADSIFFSVSFFCTLTKVITWIYICLSDEDEHKICLFGSVSLRPIHCSKILFFLLTKSNSRVFTFSQFIYENIFFFRSDNPYEPFHHFELSNGVANANVPTSAIEKLFFSIDSL